MSAGAQFDPDAFMAQRQGFDPDAFMQQRQLGQTPEQQFASAQRESKARTAANTPTPAQGALSTAQQIGRNIWGAVKGTGQMVSDVGAAITGDPLAPQRLYQSTVQPQIQQFQKAGEAATGTGAFKGAGPVSRVAGTIGYGLAGATPGVGPLAARGGEKAGAGDYPGAIADVGTAAALSVAPEYLGKTAGAVTGKIREFNTPNPDTTLYQALPFRHEMPDYYEMSPIVRGDIKRAAQQSQGAPPSTTGVGGGWQPITPTTPAQLSGEASLNDIPSVLKATQAAKAENRGVMNMHVDPYRQTGWTGRGDPIADEIVNSIPATLRARAQAGIPEAIAEVNRIVQEANVYRGPFTPDEIFGLSREFNAGLNNFFNRTSDARHALIEKGGDTTTLEAAARGARNLIRQSFGDDVADLQRRWGYLDDVEAGLRAKWKQVTKSPEETPASDLDAAMLKAGIPGKFTHGDITGAKFAWRGGKTNSLLQDTFNNTEAGWPLPTPQPGGMPGVGGMPRAQGPARQLPPATTQIPPRSGGYVSSTGMPPGPQQNVWQGIGAPRQLPAGSPTQGQGVIQVPPAGAGGPLTPGPGTANWQIPPSPRTAAPPPDTSGFVRKGPSPFGSERGSFSNRPTQPPTASGLKVGDRVAYKDDPLSIATIRNIGKTKATIEDAVARRTVPIENLVPKPLEQDMIEYYRQRPEEIRQAMPDVVEHLPPDVLALAKAPQEPLAQRMGKTIWQAVKPKVPAEQDIDFQQRFGQAETPEVAQYLGHDVPTRMLDTVRQLEPSGGPVSTNRLRQALPDVSKQDFDAAAMQLRDSGRAQLSLHSNYRNLTPAQQADMIAGETERSEITGTPYQRYYSAIAPRRP